jgi:hypothetical protein
MDVDAMLHINSANAEYEQRIHTVPYVAKDGKEADRPGENTIDNSF